MSVNDQITHLGRTLTTAASVLIGSQDLEKNVENNLFTSTRNPYRKSLQESLTAADFMNSHTFDKLKKSRKLVANDERQGLFSEKSRHGYFQNGVSDKKTTFKVLSHISDDLLHEMPPVTTGNVTTGNDVKLLEDQPINKTDKKERIVSLYQGFEASLPTVNKSIEAGENLLENGDRTSNNNLISGIQRDATRSKIKSGPWEDLLEAKEDVYISMDFNPEKIASIQSRDQLNKLSELANNNLEMLEIRKKLSAEEIDSIKHKIEKLELRQNLLIKKIAAIEENELFLEDTVREINNRVTEFDSESSNEPERNLNNLQNTASVINATRPSALERKDSIDIVESSLNKIRQHGTDTTKEESADTKTELNNFFDNSKNKKYRKASSTVQKYYSSGKKMSTLNMAHPESITCLDFDPQFNLLCTAGELDHIIKLWDYTKKRQIGSMEGHVATVSCMQMDKRYSLVATGSKDATVKLWDTNRVIKNYDEDQTAHEIHTFDAHLDEISSLYIDSDNLLTASQDKTIRRWDIYSGKCVQVFDINFPVITGYKPSRPVGSSSDNNLALRTTTTPIIGAIQSFDAALATGTKDGLVRLWDMRSGEVVRVLEGHSNAVTSLKFDSANIVSGSLDGTVRIWDLRTDGITDILSFNHPVTSLDLDPDHITVASNEPEVHVYNRKDREKWELELVPEQESSSQTNNASVYLRYKERYLMDGRSNGDVNVWIV